jgi:hypothetical protein
MLNYDAKLSQGIGLSLGGGFERLAGGYDETPLLYGAVTGKIADEMRAIFSAKQDVVADTIASLKRNIIFFPAFFSGGIMILLTTLITTGQTIIHSGPPIFSYRSRPC